MYSLKFLNSAKKELSKLDKPIQKLIKEKLLILANNPDELKNNIKPLKGEYKGKFRLRVNDYRIIYKIEDEKIMIVVIRIAHRKEVY
jgi:mRNA interferase RelE/StbE